MHHNENNEQSTRHEIVGIAVRVGSKVKGINVGDRVGVGAHINSCHECHLCRNDNENYCSKMVNTYVRAHNIVILSEKNSLHFIVERYLPGRSSDYGWLLNWNYCQRAVRIFHTRRYRVRGRSDHVLRRFDSVRTTHSQQYWAGKEGGCYRHRRFGEYFVLSMIISSHSSRLKRDIMR